MKKLALALALLLIVSTFAFPVAASEKGYPPATTVEITAQAIYLVNLDTNTVIYEKNAEEERVPASLTKIMTAILAIENTANLDTELVTYPLYVQDKLYLFQQEHGAISSGNLRAGDTLTMREYLYALMLPSANEAALTIADHLGGSQEEFIEMMNKRAKELGATSTHFVNPNGLPEDGHVSSAKDMALFTQHAMTLPDFMDIVTTTQYSASPINRPDTTLVWDTTIAMQVRDSGYYYSAIEGVKTGTLESSGRCFVSTAQKDGFQYLLVLLGSTYEVGTGTQHAFEDARAIYSWVFDSFHYKTLVEQDMVVGELPVRLSLEQDYVQLVAAEHFSSLMPDNIEATSVTTIVETSTDFLDAPVKKGDAVGELILIFDGQEIGRVPLLTAASVEASKSLVFWENLKKLAQTFWFKFLVVLFLVSLVAYIVLMVIRNRNRRKRDRTRGRKRNYR